VPPGPGAAARGPSCPASPARPPLAGHNAANRHSPCGHARPPLRPHRPGRELAALDRATPGQRNHTLNRTAFKAYRYVASGLLDDQEVTAAFTQAALAIGLSPAEVARTLASARIAGLANPRNLPTPDQEVR
jgi:hypothetical protein